MVVKMFCLFFGMAHKISLTLCDMVLWGDSGPTPSGATLTVTPVRLKRAVVTLSLLGVSEQDSFIALDELLDTRRSVGYIAQVLRRASAIVT